MTNCKMCGKELQLPFRCSYCDEFFCAEHRLPESHNCCRKPDSSPLNAYPKHQTETNPRKVGTCPRCHFPNNHMVKYNAKTMIFKCGRCGLKYGQRKVFPHRYVRLHRRKHVERRERYNNKKSHTVRNVLVAITLLAILFVGVFAFFGPSLLFAVSPVQSTSPNSSQLSLPSQSTIMATPITAKPIITTPTPTPSLTQEELVDYALSLINSDRQSAGLQNVTLSNINSGQQHAESMLREHYYSHWDTDGFKAYMRYTLAGGKGSVAENICWQPNYPYFGLLQTIKNMEWYMMYNDSFCNWGHRDNILNPLHNKVSIGIAFDGHDLYFVQNFENDYVSWDVLNADNSEVSMKGTIQKSGLTLSGVAIFYDNVKNLTVQELSNEPYQGGYDLGTSVGMALPPNWQAGEGITITATTWSQTGQNFSIKFDLSQAFARYGRGVYTLYLLTGGSTADSLTTYSIWYNG